MNVKTKWEAYFELLPFKLLARAPFPLGGFAMAPDHTHRTRKNCS